MGIISSIVSDVVHDVIVDTAVDGALGVIKAHEKFRDKHPKKTKGTNNGKIVLTPYSSKDFVGKSVYEIQSIMEQRGFKNITLIPKRDLIIGLMAKENKIESIMINGRDEFGEQAKFFENDTVDIYYHSYKQ